MDKCSITVKCMIASHSHQNPSCSVLIGWNRANIIPILYEQCTWWQWTYLEQRGSVKKMWNLVSLIPGLKEPEVILVNIPTVLMKNSCSFGKGLRWAFIQFSCSRCTNCIACDIPAYRKVCVFFFWGGWHSATLGCSKCLKKIPRRICSQGLLWLWQGTLARTFTVRAKMKLKGNCAAKTERDKLQRKCGCRC